MYNLFFYKDTKESTEIKVAFSTSPCFRIYLADNNKPLFDLITQGKYPLFSAWMQGSDKDASFEVMSKILNNNPLYPNHRVVKHGAQVRSLLEGVTLVQENLGEGDRHEFSMTPDRISSFNLVLVNLRPEGKEEQGISVEEMIHGLFTLRNASEMVSDMNRLIQLYEARGLHPFFAYLDHQLFGVTQSSLSSSSQYLTPRLRGTPESANVDNYTFGYQSHKAIQKLFAGESAMSRHPLDHGHYLMQTGGYFRDNQYRSVDAYVPSLGGYGLVHRRMATCLTTTFPDEHIISKSLVSREYFFHIINALYGKRVFDVQVNTAFSVGDVVSVKVGMLTKEASSVHPLPLRSSINLRGTVFNSDKVIGFDASRTEPVLLEKMGWVHPCALVQPGTPTVIGTHIGRRFKVDVSRIRNTSLPLNPVLGQQIEGVVIGNEFGGNLKCFMFEVLENLRHKMSNELTNRSSPSVGRLNEQDSLQPDVPNQLGGVYLIVSLSEGMVTWL